MLARVCHLIVWQYQQHCSEWIITHRNLCCNNFVYSCAVCACAGEYANERTSECLCVCVRVYERAYLIYCLGKCSYLAQCLIRFVVRLCYCWCWCCCCWFFFCCYATIFCLCFARTSAHFGIYPHRWYSLSLSLILGVSYAGSFASLDICEPKIECVRELVSRLRSARRV